MVEGDSANITMEFSLLRGQVRWSGKFHTYGDICTFPLPQPFQSTPTVVQLQVQGCHPGYVLDEDSQACVCDYNNSLIVQCDRFNRYFYARVSVSVNMQCIQRPRHIHLRAICNRLWCIHSGWLLDWCGEQVTHLLNNSARFSELQTTGSTTRL